MSLKGRRVLVTGASRGIGAAIARAVAEAGGRPVIHYGRGRDEAQALARELNVSEGDVVQADLERPGAGATLFASSAPDALVNNAGVYEPSPLGASDDAWSAAWARTLAVNLQATADLCRAAVLSWTSGEAAGEAAGIVVNIASRAGQRGDGPDHTAYAASKGGVLALTRTLARAHAGDGVRFYAIAPGWVATRMAERHADEAASARTAAQADTVPLGRFAAPEEVAALTVFLLSDACPSATGATFDVNGASYVR